MRAAFTLCFAATLAFSLCASASAASLPSRHTQVKMSQAREAVTVPSLPLFNSAVPGTMIPAIGLGTGGYSGNDQGFDTYPECWVGDGGASGGGTGTCGGYVQKAVTSWLEAGARRIDAANSYQNQVDVGKAMNAFIASGKASRSDIFLLSKVGPSHPLGYSDVKDQFEGILTEMGVDYVDLLLIHWPWDSASKGNVSNNHTTSVTPACNHSSTEYNERACRVLSWKAMVDIYASGKARAIGVSNYNITHFQEIIDADLPLPALTQSPFHIYRSATQMDLLLFTARHNIVFLGYSPFGVPDYHQYSFAGCPAANQLQHPYVLSLASKYSATPAQVLLQWQWQLGIPTNPRSMNAQHQVDNLNAYQLFAAVGGLNQTEMDTLSSQPQDLCTPTNDWYECAL